MITYTALMGDIDRLKPPQADGRHVAFVDRLRDCEGWEQVVVEPGWGPRRTARYYKTLPHIHLPDCDVWIWLDANVKLLISQEEAVRRWLKSDLATFDHPVRTDLYQEAAACIRMNKGDPVALRQQAVTYELAGHPKNWGLAETRVVIRRNTPRIVELNERWWAEIEKHSVRDQVSLPYVCWEMGMRWNAIPGRCRWRDHPAVHHWRHGE